MWNVWLRKKTLVYLCLRPKNNHLLKMVCPWANCRWEEVSSLVFDHSVGPSMDFSSSDGHCYCVSWRLTCVEAHTLYTDPLLDPLWCCRDRWSIPTLCLCQLWTEPGYYCRSFLEFWGGTSTDAREMCKTIQTITSTKAPRCRRRTDGVKEERGNSGGKADRGGWEWLNHL